MSNQSQPLVYFIGKSHFGDDEPDFIKIGYTTKLSRRVRNIQTSCESEISVMGVIPFDTKDEAISKERDIHLLFKAFCSYREWFYATPRILQYIEDYAVQYTELTPSLSDEDVVESDGPPIQDEETVVFGNWLKERREESSFTQAKLAEMVNYSSGYISFIEQGRGMPGRELHNKLTALFGDPADSTMETKSKILSVLMEDGTRIEEDKAIDTFIETIKAIGIEEIKSLGLEVIAIPLIADQDFPNKAQRKVETETGTYWIVSGIDNKTKKRILGEIADRLNLDMTVFISSRT